MRNVLTGVHLVHREIIEKGYDVTLTWVPSHASILGNESVGLEAKKAALKSPEFIPIPFRNRFPETRKRTNEIWNQKLREELRDFYELMPKVKKRSKIYKLSRREEVVINRLRLSRTRVTMGISLTMRAVLKGSRYALCVRWSYVLGGGG